VAIAPPRRARYRSSSATSATGILTGSYCRRGDSRCASEVETLRRCAVECSADPARARSATPLHLSCPWCLHVLSRNSYTSEALDVPCHCRQRSQLRLARRRSAVRRPELHRRGRSDRSRRRRRLGQVHTVPAPDGGADAAARVGHDRGSGRLSAPGPDSGRELVGRRGTRHRGSTPGAARDRAGRCRRGTPRRCRCRLGRRRASPGDARPSRADRGRAGPASR
jgi:hypothetical protein